MKDTLQLPIKRLNRLTFMLATITGIIFYIIISRNTHTTNTYIFTLFTFLGVLMVGLTDVGIMVLLARKCPFYKSKFRVQRGLITFPVSIFIYLILWPIFAHIASFKWSYFDIELFLVFVGSGLVINSMVITLHDSVLLYEGKMHIELELSKLKAANAEATNLLLKQQIQPHFLFNALNTLKALYRKDTGTADTYIVHMANFLRASIYHHSDNISSLEDEVKLLYDYLAMQRIRFGSALDCTINVADEVLKDYSLPSFSLQPLLENAIKHNNFTQQDPLKVLVSQVEDRLVISNNMQKKGLKVASTNYGLANLAERYRLWSGDEIIIKEDQNSFSVSIKLLKNEYSNH